MPGSALGGFRPPWMGAGLLTWRSLRLPGRPLRRLLRLDGRLLRGPLRLDGRLGVGQGEC